MNHISNSSSQPESAIPPDDLRWDLTVARPNEDQQLSHIALAGDTYTVLVSGDDTAGRYCLIDMLIPPGADLRRIATILRKCFTILDGEIEFTFRGNRSVARAGETINIPANAQSNRACFWEEFRKEWGLSELWRRRRSGRDWLAGLDEEFFLAGR